MDRAALHPRRALPLICLALIAAFAAGCDTTTEKSARAKVAADRELQSRKKVTVRKQDARIKIDTVQAVGKGKKAAIVVVVTNTSAGALTDLPINVGVKRGGKTKLLNRGPNIYYFYNHIPAAAPGVQTTWVAPLGRRIPKGKLFAIVGKPVQEQRPGQFVPKLKISSITAKKGAVTGSLENNSGNPQYVIELYATASKGDKFVAAGRNRVVRLANGEAQTFEIPLSGRLGKAEPVVTFGLGVLPTD